LIAVEQARGWVPALERPGTLDDAAQNLQWLEQFGLVLSVRSHPVTGALTGYLVGLGGAAEVDASLGQLQWGASEGELLPVRGRPYEADKKAPAPGEDDLAHRPLPASFRSNVAAASTWPEVLNQISRSLDMSIYSDDYTAMPAPSDRSAADSESIEGKSVAEALDALCRRYNCLWWRDGSRLFFRSRHWFIERQYEVPPRVLSLLRQQLVATGRLDTQALTALSTLTSRQLQGLNGISGFDSGGAFRIARDFGGARAAHDYLQIYALLTEAQKQRVLAEGGLPVTQMLPNQQQAFLRMLAINRGREGVDQFPQLSLKAELAGPLASLATPCLQVITLYFVSKESDPRLARLQVSFKPPRPEGERQER
jgi:hypothetical protein